MQSVQVKRALLSVFDKTGIIDFAKNLFELGIEIISTGGTSKVLHEANIPHREVEEITGFPSILDGRVKTLHPKVHAGILGKRDQHALYASEHQIEWIDLVVVNFYPFAAMSESNDWAKIVEYIDIGGPTMARAAAKNFTWVGVIVDPNDYAKVLLMLREQVGLDFDLRKTLAEKAFALTSQYDDKIHDYFLAQRNNDSFYPLQLNMQLEKCIELRYGENPHQKACAYRFKQAPAAGLLSAIYHQGKQLSYNNILDAQAAWMCVSEFTTPACVIVKHTNPCGAATASSIETAYTRAYQADALSAFGGIVALNECCTKEIAESIAAIFIEVILAPSFSEEALAILATKANLRVITLPQSSTLHQSSLEMTFITGGVLVQEKDSSVICEKDLQIVTRMQPNQSDIHTMLFAFSVLKYIKSNAILIAKDNMTVGIGAGQVSRVDAVDIALRKARPYLQDTVLASDAFFPFRDSIDHLANTGIRSIIQPGGSIRDQEVIAACDLYGIAMVFTGKRCFKH